jgi:hypothetical protein
MRRALKLHPESSSLAAMSIEVEIARPRCDRLTLYYVVTGRIDALRLPQPASPARSDRLWQHTCFEAFLRAPPAEGYYEFNFAPSLAWSAYRFGAYRAGMAEASELSEPQLLAQSSCERYRFEAALQLGAAPLLPSDAAWRVGVSAVIEETSGGKSYWALAHPPGKPDFHHADCFALELPPA